MHPWPSLQLICLSTLFLLSACKNETQMTHGYVEGDFQLISATTAGLLEKLAVSRGQSLKKDHPLFALDQTDVLAERQKALAALKIAELTLADLLKGQRPEELEIIIKQKEQAQAALLNADRDYKRAQKLAQTKATSQASLDEAATLYKTSKAKLEELDAQLKTAHLGARSDKVDAAKSTVDSARQVLAQAEKKLKDSAPTAPQASFVQDTYFRVGEYVPAGQPVVSLLIPDKIRVRFFIPQSDVPRLKLGQSVTLSYDGAPKDVSGKVTYISSNAEYTPPVIYSIESRDKLVFMIEVQPDTYSPDLRPGLPVDITLTFAK